MGTDSLPSFYLRNTLELHYYFEDGSHFMDAIIQNKCEYEFLGVIKQVASSFNTEIIIETEPLADGGLRRWFRIVSKDENKKATVTTAVIAAILTAVIVTPISTSISTITEQLFEVLFRDNEINELEKEKIKLEIKYLKLEIKKKKDFFEKNNIIRKKRSNFYETLEKYPKVQKVSFIAENESKSVTPLKEFVYRENFKKFILVTDELDPIEIENAIIEIISPVLKKGKYKWMGIYNGEVIPFHMNSKDFKTLIQNGTIQFKNGTSIECNLIIHKKMDNEGVEKNIGYKVMRVNRYFENDTPVETPEGKKYRQNRELEKLQTNLFETNIED